MVEQTISLLRIELSMNPINELGSLAGAFLCAVLFNFLYDPRKNIWLNQDLNKTATLFHRQSRSPINLKYVYELGILLSHELKHRCKYRSIGRTVKVKYSVSKQVVLGRLAERGFDREA